MPEMNVSTEGNTGSVAVAEAPVVVTNETSSEIPVEAPKTEVSSKEPTTTAQEIQDWMQDPRYGKMWKSPNDLYKSNRELEKLQKSKYDPIMKQYEGLKKTFTDNGLSLEQLNDFISEYKSFKNPENPLIANGEYVNKWLTNPMYEKTVANFFSELEKSERQRQFPNMTEQQIAEWQDMQTQLKTLQQKEQEQVFNKTVESSTVDITSGINKAKKYAESKGFEFTDDIRNEHLDYCMKQGIAPKYVYATFIDRYQDQIDKSAAEMYEKKTLEKTSKIRGAGIVSGSSNSANKPSTAVNSFDSLRDAIQSNLKAQGFPD